MKEALIQLLTNIANLFKVKTFISFGLLWVVIYLAVQGVISGDKVFEAFLIVVGFYFGTQSTKEDKTVTTTETTDEEPTTQDFE